MTTPGYTDSDRARRLPEPAKQAALPGCGQDPRPPFTRDRARVLHSAALRRLAGKTQVVGPGEGDVPRTRLTHSLEVAQISRGIGAELGADPDVTETAGLAHDIGHPPFGHNGEQALDACSRGCGGFEANAQTLRILTRLEPKVLDPAGRCHGLNLTRAVLDAVTKYPWPRPDGGGKYGVYADDLAVFEWARHGAPDGTRCLEAQIMDWADDVAYSVHDVEDALRAGRAGLGALADPVERAAVAAVAAAHFSQLDTAVLESAAEGLLALPAVAAAGGYEGSLSAQVALKAMTSELVGRFTSAVVSATGRVSGPAPLCRYAADLVVPEQVAAEVALLKAVALRFVMSDPARRETQARQRELLTELVGAVARHAPEVLDPALRPAWQAAADDAGRLRVIVDQVAALTDAQAVRWHGQLRPRAPGGRRRG